jgi:hypothetical protein
MKVAIDAIVSLLQGLERPAHIRICMVKSLEILPDVKCEVPILRFPD